VSGERALRHRQLLTLRAASSFVLQNDFEKKD